MESVGFLEIVCAMMATLVRTALKVRTVVKTN